MKGTDDSWMRKLSAVVCVAALSGCSGSGGHGLNVPPTHIIGGTVAGLAGTGLVLQLNGGNEVAPTGNGVFHFPVPMTTGAAYAVTVKTQPSAPTQNCIVAGATGSVGTIDVDSVAVACTTSTFPVGGSVSGLAGSGLVLQNNAGDDLSVSTDGAFTFATKVASGATYAVSVKTQPTAALAQSCAVSAGSGTIGASAVTGVVVGCRVLVGHFLYVPNSGSNDVSAYAINPTSGALTAAPGSPFAAALGTLYPAADPAGKYLFVDARGSSTVSPKLLAYSVDAVSGALIPLTNSPFAFSSPEPAGPAALGRPIISPSGRFGFVNNVLLGLLYGASGNASTGDLTAIPGSPFNVGILAGQPVFTPDGRFLYAPISGPTAVIAAYTVDATTGALSVAGAGSVSTGGSGQISVTMDPTGRMVFAPNSNANSVAAFLINTTTGGLTAVAGSPFSVGPSPVNAIVSPSGQFLYVANIDALPITAPTSPAFGPGSVAAFSISKTTGILTPVAGSPFATNGTQSLLPRIDPTGRFLYAVNRASNTIEAYAIDQSSGALTEVTGAPFTTGTAPFIAVIDPSGKYLYCASNGANTLTSFAINSVTGALTAVSTVATGSAPTIVEVVGLQ